MGIDHCLTNPTRPENQSSKSRPRVTEMNLRTAFDHMIPRHASWQCAGFEGRICLHQVGQNVGLKCTHFLWLKIMIHTCHIFKVKAKPLVSKIKATISHPFNRCQVITGGRCLSRGWFCDRRCSTWLGVVIGFAIFNIFVIFRNDVWQIRRFRYPTRMDEWHEPYTYTYF